MKPILSHWAQNRGVVEKAESSAANEKYKIPSELDPKASRWPSQERPVT